MLVTILLIILLLSGIVVSSLGLLTLVHLLKAKKVPADPSNRINHIRLWWFALTRPELFVDTFPWLRNDELDNFPQE